jgi:hypothetical protein
MLQIVASNTFCRNGKTIHPEIKIVVQTAESQIQFAMPAPRKTEIRGGIFKLLKSPLAGRYENPIPPRFLAPIDCSKIPAL